MRPLSLACALVLAIASSFGCGAKSGFAHMTSDPLEPAAQTLEDGAVPDPRGPDGMSPKEPPRKTPPRMDPPIGPRDGGEPQPQGTGGAPPITGRPDARVTPSEASVPPTGPVAIGILNGGGFRTETCRDRFVNSLGGDAIVETMSAAADYATFRAHDLIVACSNWAEHERPDVLGRPDLYTRYVQEGGGLLMFQPNPYPLEVLRIDLLPEWFVVANFYTDETTSLVDPYHPVTQGLTSNDMPYPADRITLFSEAWTVLSRGDQSGEASLIVADIGRGRAAVNGAHHELGVGKGSNNNSNALIRRLSLWLTHRL
jgi:hypothetical protein